MSCAANSPPAGAPSEPAPFATGARSEEEKIPAAIPPSKPTIESQHDAFLQGCMVKARSLEYCECGFEQFRGVFEDADLTMNLAPADPRLELLHDKTVAACAGKLNEEQVKNNFLEACVAGSERKRAYCTCSWKALRKDLTVTDFIGDGQNPRFENAKKQMVVACRGKLPADVTKAEFMTGCTQSNPGREKVCTCVWSKLTAKFSSEELAAGTADVQSVPGLAACKE